MMNFGSRISPGLAAAASTQSEKENGYEREEVVHEDKSDSRKWFFIMEDQV